jgi:SOS-response transcriptional repressor LexA
MGRNGAELLGTKGVLNANVKTIVESFEAQAELNPRLGKKVGHISLNFSAQDRDKISNAFMLKVADEYLRRMGIVDTQCIVVRHNDQPQHHSHCHVVFNKVDNTQQ